MPPKPQSPPAPQPHRTNPALEHRTGSHSGTFTLLLFAAASTYAGTESLALSAPTTLAALVDELEVRHPGIGARVLRSCQVAVNLEYVDVDLADVVGRKVVSGKRVGGDVVVKKGDEVAVVPPVSSG